MNITPMRLDALRVVANCPGIYASGVTNALVGNQRSWTRQGATRWGCGYMAPLAKAGLVKADAYVDSGGKRYTITPEGLAEIDRQLHAKALAIDLETAILMGALP